MLMLMQTRLSSSRLPAKALLPICGIPSAVLAAMRASNRGGSLRVITSHASSDDSLSSTLVKHKLQVYRGSLDDVLARTVNALADQPDDSIAVRLTADNMLPDQSLIESVVDLLVSQDLDYSAIRWPDNDLPYGLSVEAFRVGALRQAHQHATSHFDRENTTPWLRRHTRCATLPISDGSGLARLRCTMDTFDDYLAMSRLFERVSDPVNATWETLVKHLAAMSDSAPGLLARDSYWGVAGDEPQAIAISRVVVDASATARAAGHSAVRLLRESIGCGVTHFLVDVGDDQCTEVLHTALSRSWANRVGVLARLPVSYESFAAVTVERDLFLMCIKLGITTLDALFLPAGKSSALWAPVQSMKESGLVRRIGLWGPDLDSSSALAEIALDRPVTSSGIPSLGKSSCARHRVATLNGSSAWTSLS